MSEQNGSEPRQYPPIEYPTLEVPGHGTFVVKVSTGAAFELESMGINVWAVPQIMQAWTPHTDALTGQFVPGQAKLPEILTILSATIRQQLEISPRDLAYCFEELGGIVTLARTLTDAWTKAFPSVEKKLREWPAKLPEQAAGTPPTTPMQ